MHEIIKEKVGKLQQLIVNIMKTEDDLLLVEKILPEAHVWLDDEVNVDWYVQSIEGVKTTLRAFALEGVLLDKFEPSETSPVWYLKGKKVRIRLVPVWPSEDAEGREVCKLVKIGERTYTSPIYKLVCQDGTEINKEAT